MTRHVLLDNVTHRNLKVLTRYGPELGDDVHLVPVFPTEYADVQREYPILLRQDAATGELGSLALLGLERGENLFLDGGRWRASYVPAMVARGPFLIGFQNREGDGEARREPVVHVDLDSPRLSETEGVPVFLEHGGNSPYLQQVANILRGIQEGMAVAKPMFEAFRACGLIEPVSIEMDVHDDVSVVLQGFHTIARDRLAQLEGPALERLNRAGFLEGAFLVLSSLTNMKKLIDMKRSRGPRPDAAPARDA